MMTQEQEDKLKLHDNRMAINALERALVDLKSVEDEVIVAGEYDGKIDDILVAIENLSIDINVEIASIERMGVNY